VPSTDFCPRHFRHRRKARCQRQDAVREFVGGQSQVHAHLVSAHVLAREGVGLGRPLNTLHWEDLLNA
jgi:hypothetical protein